MPWGYTFPEVPGRSITQSNGRVNLSVHLRMRSIWHCFGTIWHCFWHYLALYWLCIVYGTLRNCIWDPEELYMGPWIWVSGRSLDMGVWEVPGRVSWEGPWEGILGGFLGGYMDGYYPWVGPWQYHG